MPKQLNRWRAVAALLLVILPAAPALPQQGRVDFAKGALIAKTACSLCHDVTFDQSDDPESNVPSFVAIANRPHQTAERLAETILFPHRDMPQFSFDRPSDLNDVIGYIMSMRKED